MPKNRKNTVGYGNQGIPALVWTITVCALAVSSCYRQAAPDLAGLPQAPSEVLSDGAVASQQNRRYDLVDSHLLVKVYRAGRLAKLGHNHVIEAPVLGNFTLAEDRVSAELFIRPADLIVDRPQTRALHGEDFAKPVKADDVEGTRGNLLSEKVLNPLAHPFIRARIDTSAVDLETTPVTFELAGQSTTREVKITTLSDDACNPRFQGTVTLRHEDFGLTPFSILGGAVSVQDAFDVSFEIAGLRTDKGDESCYRSTPVSSRSQRFP
ncbi:MAG: hypothetical protein AB8B96_04425 [Lysobacterales bacterium]